MTRPGHRIIVAVSGGPDSVCLLDVLQKLHDEMGLQLVVAHFNHGLRPEADDDETRFVESVAESYGLPFFVKRADISLRAHHGSLEEAARTARYRFLEEVRERSSAQEVAVGHNLDDQAETVIMRLLRGSGPSGLGGIPPTRDGRIIRPLIEVTRKEIEAYLDCRALKYTVDSSNLDTRFLRNKIRLELMPALQSYQPNIRKILGQTAEILRQDEEWLNEEARKWVDTTGLDKGSGDYRVPIEAFNALPPPLKNRVTRCLLKQGGAVYGGSTRAM